MSFRPPRRIQSPSLRADWLNKVRTEEQYSRATFASFGARTSYTTTGTIVEPIARTIQADASNLQQYKVKEVKDDYLRCHTWDGTTEGTSDVKVAKPYRQRKTPFHNKIFLDINVKYFFVSAIRHHAYSLDAGGTAEIRVITEPYHVDDIITAVNGVSGGTDCEDENGNPVTWLNINEEGRAWAQTFKQTDEDKTDPDWIF